MNGSQFNNTSSSAPNLPFGWRVLLMDSKTRIMASASGKGEGGRGGRAEGDLADFLVEEGVDLVEIGELLYCLEDLPAESELRARLGSGAGYTLVAKGVEGVQGCHCVALLPKVDEQSEAALANVWSWAATMVKTVSCSIGAKRKILNLLFVDENPDALCYAQTISKKIGCRSGRALNGGEALAKATKQRFDLVLVDEGLSGMGFEALAALLRERCARKWGDSPQVAAVRREARAANSGDPIYLEKPFGVEQLREAVDAVEVILRESKTAAEANLQRFPVLDRDRWTGDRDLMLRLSRALVSQGTELSERISTDSIRFWSDEFEKEVKSLKNGCEILGASRLAEACQRVVLLSQLPDSILCREAIDVLLVEIESFRLFASSNGLLG